MDRRRLALVALVAFATATAVAIAVSGTRPAAAQGLAPFVVQVVGLAVAGRLVATTVTAAGRRRRP